MLKHPLTAEIEVLRPFFLNGAVVPPGEKRTMSFVFASELVTARKAKFTKDHGLPVLQPEPDKSVSKAPYTAPGKEEHNRLKAERKAAAAAGKPTDSGLAVGVQAQAAIQRYGPGNVDTVQRYEDGVAVVKPDAETNQPATPDTATTVATAKKGK